MKHIVITGGAGMIGSHLCERFIENGYAVTAVDNLISGSKENLEKLEKHSAFDFIQRDVTDGFIESDIKFLGQYGLDGVLHFACPASPVDFDRLPLEILRVDSIGTINSVNLALNYNARYILASTSEIYGDPTEHPQKETYWGNVNTVGPRACYDEAKRFSEAYVSTLIRGVGKYNGKSYKPLNGGIVRIFNTYGPRNRLDDGRVVPQFCKQALRGEPLTVHGDGTQTRSFCYIDDLIEGVYDYFRSSIVYPMNLGNPNEYSILEFAKAIVEVSNSDSEIVFLPGRLDDPKQRRPDISLAKKELGWSPVIQLDKGLRFVLEFYSQKLLR